MDACVNREEYEILRFDLDGDIGRQRLKADGGAGMHPLLAEHGEKELGRPMHDRRGVGKAGRGPDRRAPISRRRAG